MQRRSARNETSICGYCPSLTSRKALSFKCAYILTPRSRSEIDHYPHMEGSRRMGVRGNSTQLRPSPSFLGFWVCLLRALARLPLHTAALAFLSFGVVLVQVQVELPPSALCLSARVLWDSEQGGVQVGKAGPKSSRLTHHCLFVYGPGNGNGRR